jgi:hypothetical protein
VLLDAQLAALYGVTTKALNQTVKRNTERFPANFMLRLTQAQVEALNPPQIVTASHPTHSPSTAPSWLPPSSTAHELWK